MSDMGCANTLFPVAVYLAKKGVILTVMLDSGSIAEEKLMAPLSNEFIRCIPTGSPIGDIDTFVTCLPLGDGYDYVSKNRDKIGRLVFVQEVLASPYDEGDGRTRAWLEQSPDLMCVLSVDDELQDEVEGLSPETMLIETGLPAIDEAVAKARKCTLPRLEEVRLGGKKPFVASFPGDKEGALLMYYMLKEAVLDESDKVFLIPAFHPKFKKNDPEGYKEVVGLLDGLGPPHLSVEEASDMRLDEFIALSSKGFFAAMHDSTMLWQSSGAGAVWNFLIAPKRLQKSVAKKKLVTGGFARMLRGPKDFKNAVRTVHVTARGDSVEMIARNIAV